MKAININKSVKLLCEDYNIQEDIEESTGAIKAVYLEGVAIVFNVPTRNRVSYNYSSALNTYKSLISRPFLDSHNDSSIREHPPFGHIEDVHLGNHPKSNLPCLFYKANIDPNETEFIHKAKRKDIPGVSIQVIVDNVTEKKDRYGDYLEANIREFLELSAVLIPGDKDSSLTIAESFNKMKNRFKNSITLDGIKPQRKVLIDAEEQKNYKPLYSNKKLPKINEPKRLVSNTTCLEKAFSGCNCPNCGEQLYKEDIGNKINLKCLKCGYII